MKLVVFLFLLFLSSSAWCQPLVPDTSKANNSLMRKVRSVTEYALSKKNKWEKSSYEEYNQQGLPVLFVHYYGGGKGETDRIEKSYDSAGHVINGKTYKGGSLFLSDDYFYDTAWRMTGSQQYIYTDKGKEKTPWTRTFIEYYPNNHVKQVLKMDLAKLQPDTSNIDYFDTAGYIKESLMNTGGLRDRKALYHWNAGRSYMEEVHYQENGTAYNTIVHRYKDGKEIERLDTLTASLPFYWKYDDKGRLVETNEYLYFIMYFEFDKAGYLSRKKMLLLYSDSSADKDLPKMVEFRRKYKFRK